MEPKYFLVLSRQLRKLGMKNVEAGVGCGVGVGHGFGVGKSPAVFFQELVATC